MALPTSSVGEVPYFPLTPSQDAGADLQNLLDCVREDSLFPIMTPHESSQPMIADQVNGNMEERDEGQSSSAASTSPVEASAAGKRKRKRLPVDQCSAAALRMRQMRERLEQENNSGQSNRKESLKFFSINVDQALTTMQIIVKHIQSYEIS
eukprot:3551512-Rhodomonas_salina.1